MKLSQNTPLSTYTTTILGLISFSKHCQQTNGCKMTSYLWLYITQAKILVPLVKAQNFQLFKEISRIMKNTELDKTLFFKV